MSEICKVPFPRHCELEVLTGDDTPAEAAKTADAIALVERLCQHDLNRRERLLNVIAHGVAWVILHCGEVVAVFALGDPFEDIVYLEHAVIREDFRYHGINCLVGPMQICSAVMASPRGGGLSLVMHPPAGRDEQAWLRQSIFRPCAAFYDHQARRPFWEFTQEGLVRAAREIGRCAGREKLRLNLYGIIGEITVDISPQGTPFEENFYRVMIERLSRGELSIIGLPDLDVSEDVAQPGRCSL